MQRQAEHLLLPRALARRGAPSEVELNLLIVPGNVPVRALVAEPLEARS